MNLHCHGRALKNSLAAYKYISKNLTVSTSECGGQGWVGEVLAPAHWSSAAGGREVGSMAWESTGGLQTCADPETCLSGQPKTGRWVALRLCARGCCPCPQRGPGESAGRGPFKSPQGAPPLGGDTWPARGCGGGGGLAFWGSAQAPRRLRLPRLALLSVFCLPKPPCGVERFPVCQPGALAVGELRGPRRCRGITQGLRLKRGASVSRSCSHVTSLVWHMERFE